MSYLSRFGRLRRNRYRDSSRTSAPFTIGDGVGEDVSASIIAFGRIGNGCAAVGNLDGAFEGAGHFVCLGNDQAVAIGIAVVVQYRDGYWRVLGRANGIIGSDGGGIA